MKHAAAFKDISRGVIIGLVDCVEDSSSRWFSEPLGLVLRNPRAIRPIPCTGQLGFRNIPVEIERMIMLLQSG